MFSFLQYNNYQPLLTLRFMQSTALPVWKVFHQHENGIFLNLKVAEFVVYRNSDVRSSSAPFTHFDVTEPVLSCTGEFLEGHADS